VQWRHSPLPGQERDGAERRLCRLHDLVVPAAEQAELPEVADRLGTITRFSEGNYVIP
jgi:hypothetical protein